MSECQMCEEVSDVMESEARRCGVAYEGATEWPEAAAKVIVVMRPELTALREAGDKLADAAVRILGTTLQDADYPPAYAQAVCDFGAALVVWQALRGENSNQA